MYVYMVYIFRRVYNRSINHTCLGDRQSSATEMCGGMWCSVDKASTTLARGNLAATQRKKRTNNKRKQQ